MWNTACGTRVLGKAEAELVGQATWTLTDWIRNYIPMREDFGNRIDTGILLFDQMTPAQQVVMLDRVVALLIDSKLEPPAPSALLDSTVAAIYLQIRWNIQSEIDFQDDPIEFAEEGQEDCDSFRVLVIDALNECPSWEFEPYPDCPEPDCDEMESWEMAVDSLRDRVLADEDWAMNDLLVDLPPEKNKEIKQAMGIQGNYFVDIPPIATDDDAHEAWKNIIERVTGTRPNIPLHFDDSEPF